MTNRAAVLHAVRDVRVEERPVPEPGPLDVLVEIAAVGVCGSDVHYYEHGRIATRVVRAPHVLGHESAGRVVAAGERVTKHAVGDRVALEPGLPCGRCRECRAGRYNLCRDVRFLGAPPTDGAFTRFVAMHEDFAHALPDGVSDEAGALMEPLSVALWACEKAGRQRRRPRARHRRRADRAAGRAGRARARGDGDRGDRRQPAPAGARAEHGRVAELARGRRADRVLGPPAGAPRRHRRAAPGGHRGARRHGRRRRRGASRSA